MGYQVYPASSSGGIKTVQRGLAAGAGNVTISAVDINKSFVTVFGTASSGTVAATGAVNAASGTLTAANGTLAAGTGVLAAANGAITTVGQDGITTGNTSASSVAIGGVFNKLISVINAAAKNIAMNATNINADARNIALNATTVGLNATNITGGSTNLVSAVVQGFLANGTTLTVSGACRWEVVEFN
jgi:hypothetical protein